MIALSFYFLLVFFIEINYKQIDEYIENGAITTQPIIPNNSEDSYLANFRRLCNAGDVFALVECQKCTPKKYLVFNRPSNLYPHMGLYHPDLVRRIPTSQKPRKMPELFHSCLNPMIGT